ncbi:hypothetical protein GALMADRAFT_143000 [Galerina marginata CBS 339.88]|uniref:Uncharacterized protein n=1 Tax=Galerina marginata (strain CBS 339.88) TaxID=685588 RepID=A0A067SYD8_GALM3|nr:hypothetical protein GALMADRAFT_143000 [Galerina marginata CBS 339.88]
MTPPSPLRLRARQIPRNTVVPRASSCTHHISEPEQQLPDSPGSQTSDLTELPSDGSDSESLNRYIDIPRLAGDIDQGRFQHSLSRIGNTTLSLPSEVVTPAATFQDDVQDLELPTQPQNVPQDVALPYNIPSAIASPQLEAVRPQPSASNSQTDEAAIAQVSPVPTAPDWLKHALLSLCITPRREATSRPMVTQHIPGLAIESSQTSDHSEVSPVVSSLQPEIQVQVRETEPNDGALFPPPTSGHSQLVLTSTSAITIQEFLTEHFAAIAEELALLENKRFRTAYRHYRHMKLLSLIFRSVGMDVNAPSKFGTIYLMGRRTQIDYHQIFLWSGITAGNFRNYKTKIQDAERIRMQLEVIVSNNTSLTAHAQQSLFYLRTLAGQPGYHKHPSEYLNEEDNNNWPLCLTWSIKDLIENILSHYQGIIHSN